MMNSKDSTAEPPSIAPSGDAGLQDSPQLKIKRPWLQRYQFQPGKSGNPGGRRKGSYSVTAALKSRLARSETADKVAQAIIRAAIEGDPAAMRIVLDRTDGAVSKEISAHIQGGFPVGEVTVHFNLPSNGRNDPAHMLGEVIPVEEVPAIEGGS